MLAKVFEIYGGVCAGYPAEVIVALFTLTICTMFFERENSANREGRPSGTSSHCWNGKCSPDVSQQSLQLNTINLYLIYFSKCFLFLNLIYPFRI